jgi:hypothetical protein
VFPTRLFKPAMMTPSLIGAALDGGRSLSGDAQFAELSGGGRWSVAFSDISLIRPPQVKAWRALEAALDSGATPILVPLADRRHQPLLNPKYSGGDGFGLSIWDEGVTPWTPEEITAVVAADAALRSTQLTFTYAGGAPLMGGEHFSIEHARHGARMHRISRIVAQGGTVTIEFRPPLREAVSVGELLNFESPRCTMRLDGEMAAPLTMWRWASGASVKFVETFPPVVIESEGG